MALLFSRGDLGIYLKYQVSKMKSKISSLDLREAKYLLRDGRDIAKNKALAQFVEDYKIEVPRLGELPNREKIKPPGVAGTGVSMDIPFFGYPNIFILRPPPYIYSLDLPSSIIKENTITKGGDIVLQFEETEADREIIYQTFKATYEKIQNYLTYIKREIDFHHRKLWKVAYENIKARCEELYRNKETLDRFTLASDEDTDQSRRQSRGSLEL